MDLSAVLTSLARRWYIVLTGLLITAGLGVAALQLAPLSYSATASILLLPSQASLPAGANPLLQLGGLDQPTSLVVAYLGGNDIHQQFAERYPGAKFTAAADTLGRGPMMNLTAEAPTPEEALAALRGAVDLVPGALTSLQDSVNAPSTARVRSAPLSVDATATTVKGTTLRALILAVAVGLITTFTGAVAFDSFRARRVERRGDTAAGTRDVPDATASAPPAPVTPASWPARAVAPRRT